MGAGCTDSKMRCLIPAKDAGIAVENSSTMLQLQVSVHMYVKV